MEKAYKLEFPGERTGNLFVNCCGCSQTEPLHSFGPAIKPHFLIHYVLSGKGIFSIGGKEYPLQEGYGFLITPEELSYYQSDVDEPWTYVWVGFSGDRSEKVIKNMGLSSQSPVFKSERSDEIYELVKDMMKHNTFDMGDELRRNGQLNVFLSIIADSVSTTYRGESDRANHYVRKAVEYMQCNYCNPIKITEVADYVCINRSYLYTLFMNTIGISPQQFLTTFRITKAVELLQLTGLAIETIALSCGYMDALVFAKAFKQMKGMSPSSYRKEVRKKETGKSEEHLKQVEEFINQIKKLENNNTGE